MAVAVVAVALQVVRARRAEAACRSSEARCAGLLEQQARPKTIPRDLATQTDDAMGEVGRRAADLAHDLNDLLAAITGGAELLMTRLEAAHPGRSDATGIRDAALAGARIARRLGSLGGPRPALDAPVLESSRPSGQTASILVVEDEPHVREFIRQVLTRAGHEVIVTGGPHEALAILTRRPPIEMLLVDLVIPHMSGYDLATQARLITPGVLVVYMSGFACDRGRMLDQDVFLAKPFKAESLEAAVQEALAS